MKTLYKITPFIIAISILVIVPLSFKSIYDTYVYEQNFKEKIQKINKEIKDLENEGYKIEIAKHLIDVKYNIVKKDSLYYSIIED